jgi:hypothetical protein
MTVTASQKDRILAAVSETGGATSRDLNGIAYRYAARIHELRKEGHNIVSTPISAGLWRFQLVTP